MQNTLIQAIISSLVSVAVAAGAKYGLNLDGAALASLVLSVASFFAAHVWHVGTANAAQISAK